MNSFFILSLSDPEDAVAGFGSMSSATREWLIVLGAVAFVVTLVLLWATFVRRRRRRRGHLGPFQHQHGEYRRQTLGHEAAAGVAELKQMIEERRRRRRRRRYSRNPTLAETGGLPPTRFDEPTGSSQTQPH